jgi:hypothetical protein
VLPSFKKLTAISFQLLAKSACGLIGIAVSFCTRVQTKAEVQA